MKDFTNRAGLCIDEDKVQLVEVYLKDKRLYLENVDEEFFEDSLSTDMKEAKFIYILQNALNEILLRQPLQSKYISISLPPSFFNVVELPADKNLTKNDLNEYIKWELSKLYPYEKNNEFAFQKVVLNPLNFESYKRVVVYSISKNILKRINKFCSRNNLKLNSVDSSHLASIGMVKDLIKDGNHIAMFVSKNILNVSIFLEGGLLVEDFINYSSITELLDLLKAKLKELEERKLYNDEIKNLLLFGNSIGKEFKQSLTDNFDFTITEVNPFNSLIISKELQSNKYVEKFYSKFTTATSLALRI